MTSRQIGATIRSSLSNPAWICFTWFGMTAAIAMLETPARFSAPSITREVALDVGRAVFTALNKAELAALVLLLIVVRVSGSARRWWWMCSLLALILLAQTVWLLPELTARAHSIVAGIEPPPSIAHAAYSIGELLKLGLLFTMGMMSLSKSAQTRP